MTRGKAFIVSDHTYLPDRAGGRESSIHGLAIRLQKHGFEPVVLCEQGTFADRLRRVLHHRVPYQVVRAQNLAQAYAEMVRDNTNTHILLNVGNHVLENFNQKQSGKKIIFVRDAEKKECLLALNRFEGARIVANSKFTVGIVKTITGLDAELLLPIIERDQYECVTNQEHVTFVNPNSKKGVETAFLVALNLPDIPFLLVEAWPRSSTEWNSLKTRCRLHSNIRLERRHADMKKVYSRTRVMLVPSQWEEAWGRVITEAQFSGIPSVASGIGGIPETVGAGGIVVDRNATIEDWVAIVKEVFEDEPVRRKLSSGALEQAEKFNTWSDELWSRFISGFE